MRIVCLFVVTISTAFASCVGEKGDPGQAGPSGNSGQPCTVVDNGDGTATMSCPDGTSVTWPTRVYTDAGRADTAPPPDSGTPIDASSNHDVLATDSSSGRDTVGEDLASPAHACDGLDPHVEGSYSVVNSIDVSALTGTRCVTGNLYILGNGLASLAGLASLEKVGGDLRVGAPVTTGPLNDALQTLALPALATIGGSLQVTGNPVLQTLALPALTRVGGDFAFDGNPRLPDCLARLLRDQVVAAQGIGGAVDFADNQDPCAPNPCAGRACTQDCAQAQYMSCGAQDDCRTNSTPNHGCALDYLCDSVTGSTTAGQCIAPCTAGQCGAGKFCDDLRFGNTPTWLCTPVPASCDSYTDCVGYGDPALCDPIVTNETYNNCIAPDDATNTCAGVGVFTGVQAAGGPSIYDLVYQRDASLDASCNDVITGSTGYTVTLAYFDDGNDAYSSPSVASYQAFKWARQGGSAISPTFQNTFTDMSGSGQATSREGRVIMGLCFTTAPAEIAIQISDSASNVSNVACVQL